MTWVTGRRVAVLGVLLYLGGAVSGVAAVLRYGSPAGSALMNLGARFAAAGSDARVLTADGVID